MYTGFPLDQVALLRCPAEGGLLEVALRDSGATPGRIREGALRCVGCGRLYRIRHGIVRMLEYEALDVESRHERRRRDDEAPAYETTFVGDAVTTAMEMVPTLAELRARPGDVLFELGCGTGRYTRRLLGKCRALLAIDFSAESLRVLGEKLEPDAPVGLVEADVARLQLARGAFDGGLSTLVSNLPGPGHRAAMYRLAASSLGPDGRFVFGTHQYRLPDRMRGEPKEGHYTSGGIYRRRFERGEIIREIRPHFRRVSARAVQVPVPLARRLGLPVTALSGLLGKVPLLNQMGHLLLVTAVGPMGEVVGTRPTGPSERRGSRPLASVTTAGPIAGPADFTLRPEGSP